MISWVMVCILVAAMWVLVFLVFKVLNDEKTGLIKRHQETLKMLGYCNDMLSACIDVMDERQCAAVLARMDEMKEGVK